MNSEHSIDTPTPRNQKYAPKAQPQPFQPSNSLQTFPLTYAYLTFFLSALFGGADAKTIANFWSQNRTVLKEIFQDFPTNEISPLAVKRLLMLTKPSWVWSFVEELLRPLTDEESMHYEDGKPVFKNLGSYDSSSCMEIFEHDFLVTDHGIALAKKLSQESAKDEENEFPDLGLLNLNGTVVTCATRNLPISTADRLISYGADYFIAIDHAQEALNQELVQAFNDAPSTQMVYSGATDRINGKTYTRTISVLPGSALKEGLLKSLKGVADGSIAKASMRIVQDRTIDRNELFFISSFQFNPQVAEQAARAIWNFMGLSFPFEYLLAIDFFQDFTQSKNANYVENCYLLKKQDYILSRLKIETVKSLNEFNQGSRKGSIKELVSSVLVDLIDAFRDEHKEEVEATPEAEEGDWDYWED